MNTDFEVAFWFLNTKSGNMQPQSRVAANRDLQHIFVNCLVVASSSIRRLHPDIKIKLFSNDSRIFSEFPQHCAYLEKIKVEIVELQRSKIPEKDFFHIWQEQFYILDILTHFAQENKKVLVLDLDIILLNSFGSRWNYTRNGGISIPYKDDDIINGITMKELQLLALDYHHQSKKSSKFSYFGGECIFAYDSSISLALNDVFRWSEHQMKKGHLHPKEEGHMFSILANINAWEDLRFKGVIKRVWTQPWIFRNSESSDLSYELLHLPAEKRTGFMFLGQKLVMNKVDWFWQIEDELWLNKICSIFGVGKYRWYKYIFDFIYLRKRLFAGVMKRIRKVSELPIG